MVTAIVLIETERGAVNDIAQRIAETDGVSEVYSVGGRYDLVAMIRVPTNEALARTVTEGLQAVEGIETTETLIAFRTVSQHDLESMFEIGM